MVPFEQDVQGFLKQILEALRFIHEKNIAHLDIKVSVDRGVVEPVHGLDLARSCSRRTSC